MVTKYYRQLQLLFLCLFSVISSYAQEFSFNHLTARDGLGSNFVNCIWQDKKGFLWIGSDDGLQRYDGYNFFSTRKYKSAGLPLKPVNQIIGDKNDRMFIRMGNTIGIFDASTFSYREVPVNCDPLELNNRLFILNTDAHGNAYILMERYGWFFYNEKTNAFEETMAPFKIPHEWGPAKIFDDTTGNRYWVASDHGLAYYDKNTRQLYHRDHNPQQHPLLKDSRLTHLIDFFIDSKRRYWIVNWNINQAFSCFDEKTNRFSTDTSGYSNLGNNGYFELRHIIEIAPNQLIIGYGANALIYNHTNSFIAEPSDETNTYSLQFGVIHQIYKDRENIIWLATDNGLYNTMANLHSSRHMLLSKKTKAPINALFEADNGNLVVGTWGKSILARTANLEMEGIFPKMETKDKRFAMIWDFCKRAANGDIWIGCQEGRLAVYQAAKKAYTYFTPGPFKNATIRLIKEDKQSNLWLGLQNGKIFKWNAGSTLADTSFKEVYHFHNMITDLYIDRQGLVWAVSPGKGIISIHPVSSKISGPFEKDNPLIPLYSNNVVSLKEVSDSIIAIAGDALNIYNRNSKAMHYVTEWNGQPIGILTSLQVDDTKQVWFSTTNGIYKYNIKRAHLTKYSQWDGLITISSRDYELDRSIKLRNGNLVFGGGKNLVVFDPLAYNKEVVPEKVTITSFKLWDHFLPVDSLTKLSSMDLSRKQHSFSISFAALSFSQINKLTYYYMLTGADKDWQKADASLQATYNLLPPGKYEFWVRSQNAAGVFSPSEKLKIYIHPPFWQTWWFILLISLAAASLIYAAHRLRINQLMKVENVRRKLARDLHDDMGSTLSTINILSTVSLDKMDKDNEAVKDHLSKISSSSTRIMEAMDDIVWSINPHNDSMRKIISRMKELAGDLLDARDIIYNFTIDDAGKELSFDMESRRQIFLIFKEALNNAMKYAQCTKVDIGIKIQKKIFTLYIRDNGIGFDPANTLMKKGNGLKNMYKRAEDARGILKIITSPGMGTTVTLELPVA